ncbi:molecular chaperone TorD family protein [Novispirillum sp. DQ9]|uniref:molecular chaperone TorD family protein n=1 Tax=Novispirillum sp. DQ9 TaxID=3398612 RepID=UPI003C7D15A4
MTESLADLTLTLSRALRPPLEPAMFGAMRDYLAEDLADLSAELGFSFPDHELAAFRAAMAQVPDHLTLLQLYSQVFLVPPLLVPPYVGLYLDATVLGRSVDDLRRMYHAHGVAHAQQVGELPDTLSVVLEFLSVLYRKDEEAAREDVGKLLAGYLRPAVRMMMGRMAQVDVSEVCAANPYRPLLDLAGRFLWHGDVPAIAAAPAKAAPAPVVERPEDAQTCRVCGESFLQGVELRNMRKVLRKKGIDDDFLNVCPKCRTSEMGLVEVMPPEIRRHSWRSREKA